MTSIAGLPSWNFICYPRLVPGGSCEDRARVAARVAAYHRATCVRHSLIRKNQECLQGEDENLSRKVKKWQQARVQANSSCCRSPSTSAGALVSGACLEGVDFAFQVLPGSCPAGAMGAQSQVRVQLGCPAQSLVGLLHLATSRRSS